MTRADTITLLKKLAAVAWASSWFLPVVEHYPGWRAFWAALNMPFTGIGQEAHIEDAPAVLSALTNVAFVLLFVWGIPRMRPMLFAKCALICFILNLYWVVEMVRAGEWLGLGAGYYVWLLAFALLVVIGVSGHQTSKTPTAAGPA